MISWYISNWIKIGGLIDMKIKKTINESFFTQCMIGSPIAQGLFNDTPTFDGRSVTILQIVELQNQNNRLIIEIVYNN